MSTKRPPILDEPPAVRRRRSLSEEERVLWESVAKQTRPLRKRIRATKLAVAAESPPLLKLSSLKPSSPKPAKRQDTVVKPSPPPALAPLGRRERSSLSRGKRDIDARIDLHGMTQHRAHGALLGFLRRAHDDGLTFVLVITGKGRTVGPQAERGVLRRQVPLWLALPEFRSLVVGYEEAGIGHGGEGALYVRIRRVR